MCVLYHVCEFWVYDKAQIGCIVMSSAVLFILRSRLLLYYAGSGVNRVHVVLSEFSVRFCFVHEKNVCRYGLCISWLYSYFCV